MPRWKLADVDRCSSYKHERPVRQTLFSYHNHYFIHLLGFQRAVFSIAVNFIVADCEWFAGEFTGLSQIESKALIRYS